ncbi:MAG: leucine-rich repeat domain-containing protein [Bacteroidia bacterium]|nr:leucine-rich repeat domain-containing protein [Bacteroidia bacterium]
MKNTQKLQEEVFSRISVCKKNQSDILDLSGLGLKNIPKSVFELHWLKELNLGPINDNGLAWNYSYRNYINEVNADIQHLESLEILNLKSNEIEEFPTLGKLKFLKEVDLGNNKIVEIPSTKINFKSLQQLSLSSNQLREIPEELGNLTSLTHFDISNNKLNSLPKSFVNLSLLEFINISYNNFNEIPLPIKYLHQIKTIISYDNPIQEIPEFIAKLKFLEYFTLSGCSLTKIPGFIGELSSIKYLDISRNPISHIPKSFIKLESIENLNLRETKIGEVPEFIGELNSLKVLDISHNNLTRIPDFLGKLNLLEYLNIRDNRINKFDLKIKKLRNLKQLDISSTGLSQIPIGLDELPKLEELILWNCKKMEFPHKLGTLKKLRKLTLSGNKLGKVPDFISNLTSLEELNLAVNNLKTIPDFVGGLRNLKWLHISGNQLDNIPDFFKDFCALEWLGIDDNLLKDFPDSIQNLPSLHTLNLARNQIKKIPDYISKLQNLRSIDLSSNSLNEIPESFRELKKLRPNLYAGEKRNSGLNLKGNDFGLAEEIFENEPQELIDYLLKIQKEISLKKALPLHEAKLIFIGSGGVGKTSLIKCLRGIRYNSSESITEGIDIVKWKIRRGNHNIRLNIWDFGGQEIMHATHKFFMTRRSIYVLVINPRMEDMHGDTELEYWLKLIRSYAGNEIPIIVAINKSEVHKMDIGRGSLKDKYPNIVDFVETSAKDAKGIEQLKSLIRQALRLKNMKHVNDYMLSGDLAIKTELEKTNLEYISYPDYEKLCKNLYPNMPNYQKDRLIRFLHDLGVMLNFRDDDKQTLADTQVLNPEWVTKGVYKVITSQTLIAKKGVLTQTQVGELLDSESYPTKKEWQFITEIMARFQLSFELTNSPGKFFVPGAFPVDRPSKIKWEHKPSELLRFEYHYDVLPDIVISRFITNVHDIIKGKNFWRNGVIIHDESCEALIRSDPGDRKIYIQVTGTGNKRGLLQIIRRYFRQIHKILEGIEVRRYIPLDEDGNILVNFEELLILEQDKIETYYSTKLHKHFPVSSLLDGYLPREEREKAREEREKEKPPRKKHVVKTVVESVQVKELKHKILILSSSPTKGGRTQMAKEIREIRESLKLAKEREGFTLIEVSAIRAKDISRAILDNEPMIVHFSGSGIQHEGLQVEDKQNQLSSISPKALTGLFELFKDKVKCVVLNACYSETQAKAIAQHIPYVVGMSHKIDDESAIDFAAGFYDAVGSGRDFDFAFKLGRNRIDLEDLDGVSVPILWGNGDKVEQ